MEKENVKYSPPKIWFDEDKGYYRVFTKEGFEITHTVDISIENNLNEIITCNATFQCEVVNSKPTLEDVINNEKEDYTSLLDKYSYYKEKAIQFQELLLKLDIEHSKIRTDLLNRQFSKCTTETK